MLTLDLIYFGHIPKTNKNTRPVEEVTEKEEGAEPGGREENTEMEHLFQ